METEDWRNWRMEHGSITWRVALPEDIPAIEAVIELTEHQTRMKQERVALFDSPVILTLVAEAAGGVIVDAVCIELVADIRKLGLHREAFDSYAALLPVFELFLRSRKIRLAHMAVPSRWARIMAPALRRLGFAFDHGMMSHWFRNV